MVSAMRKFVYQLCNRNHESQISSPILALHLGKIEEESKMSRLRIQGNVENLDN
jgi:hypothetical protein